MRNAWHVVSGVLSLSVALVLAGCGGATTYPTQTVTITPSAAQAIDQGQSVTLTAAVSNDLPPTAGVNWLLSGNGSLSTTTTTAIYTAPTSVTAAFTATITANSISSGPGTNATKTITVNPPLAITTTTVAAGQVGVAYSATLASTGGSGTKTWTVASGTLPAGIALSSAGVLSGTATAAGSPTLTFKVTDSSTAAPVSVTSGNITMSFAPIVLSLTPPVSVGNAVQGSAYTSGTFTTVGGLGTINWSLTGTLPAGLALSATSGTSITITGTPTAAGTSGSLVLTATDSGVGVNQQTQSTAAFTITVIPTLTEGTLSAVSAVQSVTALNVAAPTVSGGTGGYTWSATGLPTGVSINAGTGAVTGTPSTVTGSPFTASITVKDGGTPQQTKSTNLVITVIPTLAVNSATLANAVQGTAYTAPALSTTGGSGAVTWSIVSGAPTGIIINSSTGVISGTASTSVGSPFSVKVQAVDSGAGALQQTAQSTLSLVVIPTLAITSTTVPSGTVGTAYAPTTLAATGGSGTLTWSATGVPAGLSLSSAGVISGTPTVTNSANINATVTDSGTPQQTKSANLLLTIVPGTPVVSTTSLPAASVSVAYSQTLAVNANGNTGSTTWAVTSGGTALTTAGFTLNTSTGVITGTPASTTGSPVNFSVTATVGTATSAAQALSITIVTAPTITTSSLPPAYVSQAYSTTLAAAGGTGGYKNWTVTSGSATMTLLGLSLNANTGVISGTPGGTGSGSVTFTVQDSANTTSAPVTLTVSGYNVLSLPAPNPGSLPAGTNTSSYSGSISATGGVGPNYVWTVNSTQLTNNTPLAITGGGVSGLNVTTTGNGVLNVTGNPVGTGTISFNVSVKDGVNTVVGPTAYTIVVTTTYTISGNISVPNPCGTGANLAGVTVSINTTPTATTTTTDSSGNFSFPGLAAGTYILTPSYTGTGSPSVVFYPGTASSTITTSNRTVNLLAGLGYTVSGTVNYAGSKTGRVYLVLTNNTCNGNNNSNQGTSVALTSGSASYTVRGVPPGSYTLSSFMDNLGYGVANITNPVGTASGINVTTAGNTSGANVTLTDPSAVDLSTTTAPSLQGVSGFGGGALVLYKPLKNSNGVETATSYTLQYSTSSTFASGNSTKTFAAAGPNGTNVLFLTGLTNGTPYYFRVVATSGSSSSLPSTITGPITPNVPTGGNSVSGTVSFTGTATGPMYMGFFDQSTGVFYGTSFASPVNSQAYSLQVPTGSNYFFVAGVDQNNDGLIDVGDLSNTGNDKIVTVISGPTTGLNLTLPSGNSAPALTTQVFRSTSGGFTNTSYSLNIAVDRLIKLPVAVTLTSGNNVIRPLDIGICTTCGRPFNYGVFFNGVPIVVGDGYGLNITYSDGTSETVTPTVGTVLNAFATALTPNGTTYTQGTGTRTTPTFTWTDPANASNYTYQFYMNNSNGQTIWQVPGQNSNSNGFASTITTIPWITSGNDVVGDSNNLPKGNGTTSGSSLNVGTGYSWSITTQDSNGNTAIQQVQYLP